MKTRGLALAVIFFVLFAVAAFAAAEPVPPRWVKQFGTDGIDYAKKIVADANGNVYVAGTTYGAIGGVTTPVSNMGGADVFVAKFNPDGALLWTVQFGTAADDFVEGLTLDKFGALYVVGSTEGSMPLGIVGNANAGGVDCFLAKISDAGTIGWIKQFGTSYDDHAYGLATDADGSIFVVGATKGDIGDGSTAPGDHYEAFLIKFEPSSGSRMYATQFNVEATDLNNFAYDIAIHSSGNNFSPSDIFVTGLVQANPGGSLFIAKFNGWCDMQGYPRTLGGLNTENNNGARNTLAIDKDENLLVAGYTLGAFDNHASAGNEDIVVVKFDKSLNKLWSRQYGTAGKDVAYGLAVDAEGNIYVAGETGSPSGPGLDGQQHLGASDMFLTRFAPDGQKIYTRQIGTGGQDYAYGIALDTSGALYVAGATNATMGDQRFAAFDAVLIKCDKDGPVAPPVTDFYINVTVRELPSGSPLSGVSITVKDGDGKEVITDKSTTDALGQFNLQVPAAGKYSIYKFKLGYTAQVDPDVVELTEAAPTATPVSNMQKIVVKTSMSIRKGYSTIRFTKLPEGDRSVDAVFGKYAGKPYVEILLSLDRPMQYPPAAALRKVRQPQNDGIRPQLLYLHPKGLHP